MIVMPIAQLLEQLLPAKHAPTTFTSTAQLFDQLFAAKKSSGGSVTAALPGSSYMEALKRHQNRALTQNNAEAYRSTESAILDAFSGLNANSSAQDIHKKLQVCWHESPELTLRIIWNMRSIPEGHSNKLGFYHAFGWLYKNHPRTAIENLQFIVEPLCERTVKRKQKGDEEFEMVDTEEPSVEVIKLPHGYYKDLLNILILAMRNELGNPSAPPDFKSLKVSPMTRETRDKDEWEEAKETKKNQNKMYGVEEAQRLRAEQSRKKDMARAKRAKLDRTTKRQADFAVLKPKLERDGSFFALYATIAHIFAVALASDIALLKRAETASKEELPNLRFQITSVSKWAPTLDGFHDRATNLSTAIALILHARGHMADLPLSLNSELTQKHAHTLRSYYRRWIISPLRRFTDVTEVKMSARKWDQIDYSRVSGECMNANKGTFFRHDEKRFLAYLVDVEEGKSNISGATLLPHELLIEALQLKAHVPTHIGKMSRKVKLVAAMDVKFEQRMLESNKKVVSAQWNSLLEHLRESGALESSLALVDVSGSMGSIHNPPPRKSPCVQPIFPAIALGLILSELASPPFSNTFITFSINPKLLTLGSGNLVEKARRMGGAEWTMNTNYEAVFLDLLLPAAIQNQIKPEDMVKRLFVFSDMQFDASTTNRSARAWETTHDRIVKAYKEAGYEMPDIVYWNLEGGTTKPVLKDTPGTVLLTGFSANMLKLFMEGDIEDGLMEIEPDGEVRKERKTPLEWMRKALSKSCYDPLKVYD
ncbi:hypothetical protein FRC07_011010 [Ceratobasidium sp. 392]|nr:hypothetical protein FRC07_011010 [Ceratobasidium sp. 392]